MNKKVKSKKRKKTKIIIGILIFVLLVGAIGFFYVNGILSKVNTTELTDNDEELGITEVVMPVEKTDVAEEDTEEDTQEEEENNTLNIALFGVDKRENDSGRSDTIMILSINYDQGKIKLSSIMRDTYVAVEGHGMTKINHAYAYGGTLLSIKTINQNFNLDVRDYVMVDFDGLKDIVDTVGGVDIDIKSYELATMKRYGITSAGVHHLNGTQALAYCRIRYQGNGDYERTDRQRAVLQKLFEEVNLGNVVEMTNLLNKVLPFVETSYDKNEILSIMTSVVSSNTTSLEQKRFPVDGYCQGKKIDGVYYLVIDKEENTKQLKEFIYN